MITPKDFQFLAVQIFALTNQSVSPPTLRRIWGYQDNGRFIPRRFTLDVLAKYAGFKDWESVCTDASEEQLSSDFLNNRHLDVKELQPGDRIRLIWKPNRCVIIKFEGMDIFVVEDSENSKLRKGNRFCCRTFIQNEPLYLERLMRDGCVPTNFVCGKYGGITYEVIRNYSLDMGGVKDSDSTR